MSTPFSTRSMRAAKWTLSAAGLLALVLAGSASADEGHAHANPAAAVAPIVAPGVVEEPAPASPAPVNHAAHSSPAPAAAPAVIAPTSGGGGVSSVPTSAAAPTTASPTGELPFTGTEDNILLLALAGMLVPMGVLLYSAARRGDLRLRLAAPRFQWTTSVGEVTTRLEPAIHVLPASDPSAFQWADR
ncbi:MAG: hypothetical protein JWM90_1116 [Thermoleophilia bacterium]|nr:hypothetical protein [Thermoleophilia bacterium]